MKKYLLLLLLTVAVARGEIEFAGFFLTSKEALFTLTDTETGRSSGWLAVGQSFGGYTVASFDRAREVITLKRGDASREIPLRQPKVKEGKSTIVGTITVMGETIDGVQATLFMGEESEFPLKNGTVFRLKPEPFRDGNILYRATFVTKDKDGKEQVISAPRIVAMPGKPFGIQIGEIGFSFKP